MKLLISAYACGPNLGSEEGHGWNWATEAHRLGHEVWVLASTTYREAIQEACRADRELDGIHWIFPEVRGWRRQPVSKPKWERTHCLLWQRAALAHARELCCKIEFDAVHHVTWAGLRVPTFLGSLGPPLILGSVGGGETSPRMLRDGFPWRGRIVERVRDFANATVTINPWIRRELTQAAVIFVKTPDTAALLSRKMRDKSIVFMDIGLPQQQIGRPRAFRRQPCRLLYVGRLLYWKGVHIALRALADLARRRPDVRLTVRGTGPEQQRLHGETMRYGVADLVDFVAWMPQEQLFELYAAHDLFVFPSLHDSGGNVLLEAFAHGLPVVCLDLGGPKQIVTPKSGLVVATDGRNTAQVAAALADELFRLLSSSERMSALSAGAVARAREFLLSDRIAQFYRRAEETINTTAIKRRAVSKRLPAGAASPPSANKRVLERS